MLNNRKTIMALMIASLALTSYGGEFTLKKADHDLLLKKKIYSVDMLSTSLMDLRRSQEDETTKGLIEPKTALFINAQRKSFRVLVYKSSIDSHSFDRVMIRQNRDFADDGTHALDSNHSAVIKMKTPGDEEKEYRVILVNTPDQECGWAVALLPMNWMEGTVTLAGKQVRAVWMQIYKRDRLMTDTDGDGAFSPHPYEDVFDVAPLLWINNACYETMTREDENAFDLKPIEAPMGQLMLSGEMIPPGTNNVQTLGFWEKATAQKTNRSLDFVVQTRGINQLLTLPVGVYDLQNGYVANQEKNRQFVCFSVDNIRVTSNGVTTLNLIKPAIAFKVEQENRMLRVYRVFTCENEPSLSYHNVGGGEYSLPLTIDVVDAADPAKVIIARSNMEYG